MSPADVRYWHDVGQRWVGAGRDVLWRRHCDAVNSRLLSRWLPHASTACLLKTDLFDEALTGGLASRLRGSAKTIVGMDLSLAIAREAAARCPDILSIRADARQLPFADRAFDTVVSLSTLDHFRTRDELKTSLRELGRILRGGGTLVLTMDNPRNPLIGLRNALPYALLNRLGVVPYFVGVTAGPRGIQAMLREAGFTVVETTSILHCLRVLTVPLCRLIQRFGDEPSRGKLLSLLLWLEGLGRLPTHFTTGNFVAVLARK